MIEHPTPDKQMRVSDFRLLPTGQIAPPAVDIIRPGEELATATITLLMKKVTDDLACASEVMIAHLCNVNVQPFAGMPICVVELPLEQRPNKNQRMFYASQLGDQIVRMG
jgi:hypothetical protein